MWIGPKYVTFLFFAEAFYTTTRVGRPALIYNRYRYNQYIPYYKRADECTTKKYWRCAKWQRGNCRAAITTIEEMIVKISNQHNHWHSNCICHIARLHKCYETGINFISLNVTWRFVQVATVSISVTKAEETWIKKPKRDKMVAMRILPQWSR